ncbi:Pyruvate kinase [hydrothermal vent metagenome]|uniref:pyruvate kinase n=1 Tax=hydrothermal vent metagenome TaxID=652676 RepID=A0A3B0WBT3_9ZZZZ
MKDNKTKIVATLGPASDSPAIIKQLIQCGVNVFRLNFSHGTHDQHRANYNNIRNTAKDLGKVIGILLDLQGPKIRVGKFANDKVVLTEGDMFILSCDSDELGSQQKVSVSYKELYKDVVANDELLFDDGKLRVVVKSIVAKEINTIVIVGGTLGNNKGINIPTADLSVAAMTKKDIEDLAFGVSLGVDWVALSFVRKHEDLLLARHYLNLHKSDAKLMAKIEKPAAITNFDEILATADGIMVARGDLGVELSPQEVPMLQKRLIRKSRQAGKPVVTATQMLETMITSPVPTRAEASDVANAIFDGTDAIMLSAETAVGKFPLQAVTTMRTIANSVEKDDEYTARMLERQMHTEENTPDAVSSAACNIASNIKAKVMVCFSSSGATALRVARNRIQTNVIAISPKIKSCQQLSISWGIHPVLSPDANNTNDMVTISAAIIHKCNAAEIGDRYVITAGVPFGMSGTTNIIRVEKLT